MSEASYDDLDDEPFVELPDDADDELVSVEERARAMGWKPREEYRGPAHLWSDAATFIERGERELPIMRDQNRRMGERLARVEPRVEQLERDLEASRQATREALDLARRADDRGYQRAMSELKAQQREAVASGDVETFERIEGEIDQLNATHAPAAPREEPPPPPLPPPPAPAPPPGQIDPHVQNFVRQNAHWFVDTNRPELNETMVELHKQVIGERQIPGLPEQLEEARNRLAARFPQYPDILEGPQAMARHDDPPPPARRAPAPAPLPPRAAVPRDNGNPRQRSPFERIPAEERDGCRKAYTNMKRADPGLTEAEYVALYLDPRADVLELRRQHRK